MKNRERGGRGGRERGKGSGVDHEIKKLLKGDDDCFYYHSWRNNVVIAFGTLSSFLT